MGSNDNRGGIGCAGVLLIVFVVLKLTGNINWSWLWVLSPLWGSFALIVVALLVMVAIAVAHGR